MNTDGTPQDFTANTPETVPNNAADASGGDLFIRDLASTSTQAPKPDVPHLAAGIYGGSGGDEDEGEADDGMVTTMMLGEEGDRGGEKDKDKEKKDKDKDVMTTLALGEEGRGEDTSAAARKAGPVTTMALGEEGDRGANLATTMAVGEEGDRNAVTTLAVGEEGDRNILTTLALGEEGGEM